MAVGELDPSRMVPALVWRNTRREFIPAPAAFPRGIHVDGHRHVSGACASCCVGRVLLPRSRGVVLAGLAPHTLTMDSLCGGVDLQPAVAFGIPPTIRGGRHGYVMGSSKNTGAGGVWRGSARHLYHVAPGCVGSNACGARIRTWLVD